MQVDIMIVLEMKLSTTPGTIFSQRSNRISSLSFYFLGEGNTGNDADNAITTDLDASPKYGTTDMGAYELQQAATSLIVSSINRTTNKTIASVAHTVNFTEDCELIVTVKSADAITVAGNVTAKVWIEPTALPINGWPFVRRHYEINPDNNSANATGTVTLYFTQADFDDYNAFLGNTFKLPSNKDDLSSIITFAIYQYDGISSNGTALPDTYPGQGILITVPEVQLVWNATMQWWEATFMSTGFGGYIAGSLDNFILPINNLLRFNVTKSGNSGVINWQLSANHTATLLL